MFFLDYFLHLKIPICNVSLEITHSLQNAFFMQRQLSIIYSLLSVLSYMCPESSIFFNFIYLEIVWLSFNSQSKLLECFGIFDNFCTPKNLALICNTVFHVSIYLFFGSNLDIVAVGYGQNHSVNLQHFVWTVTVPKKWVIRFQVLKEIIYVDSCPPS